jgi:hypothetical protein
MQIKSHYAKVALTLMGILAFIPRPAGASGPEDTRAEVAIYGGGLHYGSGAGTHAAVGGAVGFNAARNFQLFGEANYVPLGSYHSSFGGVTESGSSKLLNFGGGVQASFGPHNSKAIPYALGVVGEGHAITSASTSSAGFSASSSVSGNSVYAGVGGGLKILAGSTWGFRPEFRYQRHVQNGGANTLMFTVGLFFGFVK